MLIGMVGFAGSGKGTVSDILVGQGFKKMAFADPVKDAVSAIFGWNRSLLEGDTKESRDFRETYDPFWDATPRKMLQLMGTEAGRNVFRDDIWIRSMEARMSQYKDVVIADVRFSNEIQFIKSKGGFIVCVARQFPEWFETARTQNLLMMDNIPSTLMQTKYPEVHYSEWAWVGHHVDFLIDNNSNLDTLKINVKHCLKQFLGPIKDER
jgi:hypothetical protein